MFVRGTAMILLVLVSLAGVGRGDGGRVVVSLVGVAHPAGEIVTVADVARISGGDLITRRRIAALDVAEVGGDRTTQRVSKRQVNVRILLSGVSPNAFKVTGAENVLFKTVKEQSTQTRILAFLRPDVARRLRVDPADVQLRLTRPLTADSDQLFRPGVRLEHFLPPTIRLGPINVRIGLYDGDRLVRTAAVSLEVQVAREVQVAKQRLESGTTISADDVVTERRILSGQIAKYAASDVVGKSTRRAVQVGTILSELDLQRSSPTKKEIVIRSRDVVEVVARRKGLQIKISGVVALQQGAIGDAIRVRNPDSAPKGRVFTAKVVDAGVVEIRL